MQYTYGDLVNVNEEFDIIIENYNTYSITKFNNKISSNRISLIEDINTVEINIDKIILDEDFDDGFLFSKVLESYSSIGGSRKQVRKYLKEYYDARKVNVSISNIHEALNYIPTDFIVLDKSKLRERHIEIVTENEFFINRNKVPVKVLHNDKLVTIGEASRIDEDITLNESNQSIIKYTWKPKKSFMSNFNMKTDDDKHLLMSYLQDGYSFTEDGIFKEYEILKSINEFSFEIFKSRKLHNFDYDGYIKKVKKYHKGKLYVFGFATDTTSGKIIRAVTGKDITHNGFALDPSFNTMLAFVRYTGLKQENVLLDYHSKNKYVAYEIPITKDQLQKLLDKLKDINDSGFDYSLFGAIKSVVTTGRSDNKDDDGGYRLFCSQFTDMMLKEIGVDVTNINSGGVTPGMLTDKLNLSGIKKYDEGNLYRSYFKLKFNIDILDTLSKAYKKFRFQITKLKKNITLQSGKIKYHILPIFENSQLFDNNDHVLLEDKHNPYKNNVANNKLYYHASPAQNIKELKLNFSKTSHNKNFVPKIYASSDVGFAAGFCFDWGDSDIKFYRKKDSSWIIEIPKKVEPNLNKPASMYFIEPATFKKAYGVTTPEVVSEKNVKIVKEIKYKSAKECLIAHGIDITIIK